MREIFKRDLDGEEIYIEVVLDANRYKSNNPWLVSVFIKYNGLDDSSQAYEEFLETKESLIIAVEYDDKAKYLGMRVIDGWSELYFCASTAKEFNSMITTMLKNTNYIYESNIIKDKKWNFYETQLFPTALEEAYIQSAKIIFLLEEEGDNLEALRDVEYYISFETPTSKDRFIDELNLDGFSFKDEISSEEFPYGVAIVKEHQISEDILKNNINEVFEFMKKYGAFYEGWSTTLAIE